MICIQKMSVFPKGPAVKIFLCASTKLDNDFEATVRIWSNILHL